MASRIQRFLAAIDRFVHEFFRMERDETRGLYHYKNYFWGRLGRRCAILNKEGRVIHLGYSWTVQHHFNNNGVLLSRLTMKHLASPTDRVLYGQAADNAWNNDERSRMPLTGGFLED